MGEGNSTRNGRAERARTGVGMPALVVLLLIAGLPDAMIVPVLRGLTVDRYGMTEGAAHLFMSASLVGAMLVSFFATPLRRRLGLRRVVCLGAAANAALLLVIAMPVGSFATVVLRMFEGAADLIVYAVLFDRIAHAGCKERRGARLGLAAMTMMIGIALGMVAGGFVGRDNPLWTLAAGAMLCTLLCGLCAVLPLGGEGAARPPRVVRDTRAMLAPMVQVFADRAAAGVLTTSVPLYLAAHAGMTPASIGARVGTVMLVMALALWPAGRLVDRLGALRVRTTSAIVFGVALACTPFVLRDGAPGMVGALIMGLSAAGLFGSAIVQAAAAGKDAGGMAGFYTAGNLGFFVGPLLSAGLLSTLGGHTPGAGVYAVVFACIGALHIALSGAGLALLRGGGASPVIGSVPVTTVTDLRRAA